MGKRERNERAREKLLGEKREKRKGNREKRKGKREKRKGKRETLMKERNVGGKNNNKR